MSKNIKEKTLCFWQSIVPYIKFITLQKVNENTFYKGINFYFLTAMVTMAIAFVLMLSKIARLIL